MEKCTTCANIKLLCAHCEVRHKILFYSQAEDGIRDIGVTGVQTCALPISPLRRGAQRGGVQRPRSKLQKKPRSKLPRLRSEERRVGKECRSRGSPSGYKKKRDRLR